jgi:ubiquitin-protein ligase
MDVARIRREVAAAQAGFSYVECHSTSDTKPYVLAALQTSQSRIYTLTISFPDAYPYALPTVSIRKPEIHSSAPHRYTSGSICYLHPDRWNPGHHTLTFVLARAAKWLAKYEVWLVTGQWPGAEVRH